MVPAQTSEARPLSPFPPYRQNLPQPPHPTQGCTSDYILPCRPLMLEQRSRVGSLRAFLLQTMGPPAPADGCNLGESSPPPCGSGFADCILRTRPIGHKYTTIPFNQNKPKN